MSGMDLLRRQRGLMARVAAELGLTRAAVATWDKVPAERVAEIARISGIPAAQLRPDLAKVFAARSCDEEAPRPAKVEAA